ncbi:conserved Plasmodium protein, unknown function [Plasmodium ovale wallikeri]|uniref:MI domain-containing protein n=1 Tax=Plasmodium ovale wallikeri TaxID=864142 RepID=A0A1A8ZVC1_PLAOA|nr:conserved Plasmodium protein, unknown function [Plasmodium ovale wallikeri]SBT48385.1 conserved Plasmodium protein, unknown function [Plasmodium ovale wallikeri]
MTHNHTSVFLFTVQGILASLTCGLCCFIYAYCCNNKNDSNNSKKNERRNKRSISKLNSDNHDMSTLKKNKIKEEEEKREGMRNEEFVNKTVNGENMIPLEKKKYIKCMNHSTSYMNILKSENTGECTEYKSRDYNDSNVEEKSFQQNCHCNIATKSINNYAKNINGEKGSCNEVVQNTRGSDVPSAGFIYGEETKKTNLDNKCEIHFSKREGNYSEGSGNNGNDNRSDGGENNQRLCSERRRNLPYICSEERKNCPRNLYDVHNNSGHISARSPRNSQEENEFLLCSNEKRNSINVEKINFHISSSDKRKKIMRKSPCYISTHGRNSDKKDVTMLDESVYNHNCNIAKKNSSIAVYRNTEKMFYNNTTGRNKISYIKNEENGKIKSGEPIILCSNETNAKKGSKRDEHRKYYDSPKGYTFNENGHEKKISELYFKQIEQIDNIIASNKINHHLDKDTSNTFAKYDEKTILKNYEHMFNCFDSIISNNREISKIENILGRIMSPKDGNSAIALKDNIEKDKENSTHYNMPCSSSRGERCNQNEHGEDVVPPEYNKYGNNYYTYSDNKNDENILYKIPSADDYFEREQRNYYNTNHFKSAHSNNRMHSNFVNMDRNTKMLEGKLFYNDNPGISPKSWRKSSLPQKYITSEQGCTSKKNRMDEKGYFENDMNNKMFCVDEKKCYNMRGSVGSNTNSTDGDAIRSAISYVSSDRPTLGGSTLHAGCAYDNNSGVTRRKNYFPVNTEEGLELEKCTVDELSHECILSMRKNLSRKEKKYKCADNNPYARNVLKKRGNRNTCIMKNGYDDRNIHSSDCQFNKFSSHHVEKINENKENFANSNKYEYHRMNCTNHFIPLYNSHKHFDDVSINKPEMVENKNVGIKNVGIKNVGIKNVGIKSVGIKNEDSDGIYFLTDDNTDCYTVEKKKKKKKRSLLYKIKERGNKKTSEESLNIDMYQEKREQQLRKLYDFSPETLASCSNMINNRKDEQKSINKYENTHITEKGNASRMLPWNSLYEGVTKKKETKERKNSEHIKDIICAYLENSKNEYNLKNSCRYKQGMENMEQEGEENGIDEEGDGEEDGNNTNGMCLNEEMNITENNKKKTSYKNSFHKSFIDAQVNNGKERNKRNNVETLLNSTKTSGNTVQSKNKKGIVNLLAERRVPFLENDVNGKKEESGEQIGKSDISIFENTKKKKDIIIYSRNEKNSDNFLTEKEAQKGKDNDMYPTIIRRSARMKSEKYKKKKLDCDMEDPTKCIIAEKKNAKMEENANNNTCIKKEEMTEKKKKKISKTKPMELKIVRKHNILNEEQKLKFVNEKYDTIDEHRCASGFVNFLIEHIQNTNDKENFDKLLKYILKLINIYKIKTVDFIEAFLILETINIKVIREHPVEEWILVTFHFLKGNIQEHNLKFIINSLKLDNFTVTNVTASFYMNKKSIKMTEKNINRIVTILSKVVRRRSSRIKISSKGNVENKSNEEEEKDELLGSCWQPVSADTTQK